MKENDPIIKALSQINDTLSEIARQVENQKLERYTIGQQEREPFYFAELAEEEVDFKEVASMATQFRASGKSDEESIKTAISLLIELKKAKADHEMVRPMTREALMRNGFLKDWDAKSDFIEFSTYLNLVVSYSQASDKQKYYREWIKNEPQSVCTLGLSAQCESIVRDYSNPIKREHILEFGRDGKADGKEIDMLVEEKMELMRKGKVSRETYNKEALAVANWTGKKRMENNAWSPPEQ